MHGIILLNKQKGITSNYAIQVIKKKFEIKTIGHCGTLDPLASGLLLICIGNYTKLSKYLTNLNKKYIVSCKTGIKTYSNDITGDIIDVNKKHIKKIEINNILNNLNGIIYQKPPMLSAIKYKGIPLYKYAKKNININIKKRKIYISQINILKKTKENIIFNILCSKGTYIREIISEINKKTKIPLCITEIHRITSGCFNISESHTLFEILNKTNINSMLIT